MRFFAKRGLRGLLLALVAAMLLLGGLRAARALDLVSRKSEPVTPRGRWVEIAAGSPAREEIRFFSHGRDDGHALFAVFRKITEYDHDG